MYYVISLIVLSILVFAAAFIKNTRFRITTMVILIIALLVREVNLVVHTYSVIESSPLEGAGLDYLRKAGTYILKYYYWTELYAIPAYIILVVLCVQGCRGREPAKPRSFSRCRESRPHTGIRGKDRSGKDP